MLGAKNIYSMMHPPLGLARTPKGYALHTGMTPSGRIVTPIAFSPIGKNS